VAQEASGYQRVAGSDFLIGSSNFWVSPYRSYPHPPTELEQLAVRLGISDEELRMSLREQIQRRRREVGAAWEKLDSTLEKRENGG
jgi:hypothetical protein